MLRVAFVSVSGLIVVASAGAVVAVLGDGPPRAGAERGAILGKSLALRCSCYTRAMQSAMRLPRIDVVALLVEVPPCGCVT